MSIQEAGARDQFTWGLPHLTLISMALYKGTYRIETTRLAGYDYRSPGWYHVVMCTTGRLCFFGDVVDGMLHHSRLGRLAHEAWPATLDSYDRAVQDVFVVMPNHVHVIVGIKPRPLPETPPAL